MTADKTPYPRYSSLPLQQVRAKIENQLAAFNPDKSAASLQAQAPAPSEAWLEQQEERRKARVASVEERSASYLQGLPDRCQQCLSTVMMNMAVSVEEGVLDADAAMDAAHERREEAAAYHNFVRNGEEPEPFCPAGQLLFDPNKLII
jgi:hypothetical protein